MFIKLNFSSSRNDVMFYCATSPLSIVADEGLTHTVIFQIIFDAKNQETFQRLTTLL